MIWNFFTIVSEYAGADESIEHSLPYFQVTHSQSAFISEWLLEQKFPSVCLAKPGHANCVPYTLVCVQYDFVKMYQKGLHAFVRMI